MKLDIRFRLFLALLIKLFIVVTPAYAQSYGQYGSYGAYGSYGSNSPQISILVDKSVSKPVATQTKGGRVTDLDFVDNLSSADPRFAPKQEVVFRIRVKNTANKALTNVTLQDTVPSYINPIDRGDGYDEASRVITVKVGDLAIDEEKVYLLKATVASQEDLPSDRSIICVVNKVRFYSNETSDDDTAQFCIEKQIQNVTNVPNAGPEMGLGLLALQLTGLGAGLYLKKRVS